MYTSCAKATEIKRKEKTEKIMRREVNAVYNWLVFFACGAMALVPNQTPPPACKGWSKNCYECLESSLSREPTLAQVHRPQIPDNSL